MLNYSIKSMFHNHIVKAASGDETAESKVGRYLLGGAATGTASFAFASSNGSDDGNSIEPVNQGSEDTSNTESVPFEPIGNFVEETSPTRTRQQTQHP